MKDLALVAAGAVLTGLFGLIGSQVTAAREHRRWLREERLRAYETLLWAAKRCATPSSHQDALDVLDQLGTAHLAVELLGPTTVLPTAKSLYEAAANAAGLVGDVSVARSDAINRVTRLTTEFSREVMAILRSS